MVIFDSDFERLISISTPALVPIWLPSSCAETVKASPSSSSSKAAAAVEGSPRQVFICDICRSYMRVS